MDFRYNSFIKKIKYKILDTRFYSYLKASIGFKAAALRAGYQPKKMPTIAENKKDNRIEEAVIVTGHPPNRATIVEIRTPKTIPINPPRKLMNTDSIIN